MSAGAALRSADCFLFFALQIICVIVPIGQYTHQLLGLNKSMVSKPSTVEVSITP